MMNFQEKKLWEMPNLDESDLDKLRWERLEYFVEIVDIYYDILQLYSSPSSG